MIGEEGLCPVKGSDIHHVASKPVLTALGQLTDALQPEKLVVAIEAQHKLPLYPIMGQVSLCKEI
jgi:hypothetical protein